VLCRFCSEAGKQLTSLLPNGDEPVGGASWWSSS
jgi:hypothetical protein